MDPNSINPHEVELREQDRWLPIANVARLMKNTLPPTAKVSKDAKECMQECVSEFISFVTSEASDRCLREKRKTINGEDILYSMHDLGFENYAEVLKIFLAKYREQQALKHERGETKMTKKQLKAQRAAQEAETQEADTINSEELEENGDEDPRTKLEKVHEGGSHTPGASSIGSSESFFEQYDGDEPKAADKELATHKEYEYDIDELAKHLTNEDPDINTLTAGIASTNENGYF
ncbi:transcriptional activator hap3 [Yamadazyma tenuis]|uniref:Histone-fold-containing protein n=1 Tax=Candida tenuis (strain ATCC 10573 / BCRC 21748 / CBS 615 / JCM 9827 / NBRC 10315 / NRRL Y-1498 / VKM Y-70) TaxID=590646 RepID=G3BFE5_CANTC|nr:histone-fold-containing protein [Yamadazyma tenuis ATCC 10573]EGV60668.1 histone-fold-containing protein [Yamadazyma tenuis ATCC 10573]WEJ94080.1 transcriptional activator hap3 [Yamadazyma tenuis]